MDYQRTDSLTASTLVMIAGILLLPLVSFAQVKAKKQPAADPGKKALDTSSLLQRSLMGKKTMTFEELAKLGIELPGTYFIVTGNISGLKDSTSVMLTNTTDGKKYAEGSVVNGRFRLKGRLDHEGLYSLFFDGEASRPTLFMGNDSVTVSGDIGKPLEEIKITGGPITQDFEQYRHGFDAESAKLSMLLQQINSTDPGRVRDSLISGYKAIVLTAADEFIRQKPASATSAFVLFTVAGLLNSVKELESRFDILEQSAKNSYYASFIKRKINEEKYNLPGSVAPVFVQKSFDSKPVSLRSFQGRIVLLHFWASGCKPCEAEMPALKNTYASFASKGFAIVGISLDEEKLKWKEALSKFQLPWKQISDLKGWNNEVALLYKIETLPQNILIDRNGKIIAKNLSMAELENKLKGMLP